MLRIPKKTEREVSVESKFELIFRHIPSILFSTNLLSNFKMVGTQTRECSVMVVPQSSRVVGCGELEQKAEDPGLHRFTATAPPGKPLIKIYAFLANTVGM
jgi:hypothetical protein